MRARVRRGEGDEGGMVVGEMRVVRGWGDDGRGGKIVQKNVV